MMRFLLCLLCFVVGSASAEEAGSTDLVAGSEEWFGIFAESLLRGVDTWKEMVADYAGKRGATPEQIETSITAWTDHLATLSKQYSVTSEEYAQAMDSDEALPGAMREMREELMKAIKGAAADPQAQKQEWMDKFVDNLLLHSQALLEGKENEDWKQMLASFAQRAGVMDKIGEIMLEWHEVVQELNKKHGLSAESCGQIQEGGGEASEAASDGSDESNETCKQPTTEVMEQLRADLVAAVDVAMNPKKGTQDAVNDKDMHDPDLDLDTEVL